MRRILSFGIPMLLSALLPMVATVAPAASADPGRLPIEPVGAYMASVVREKLAGEYASAWETLYPPHQAVAPLDAYVGCETLIPTAGTLVGVKVLHVFRESILIAGTHAAQATRAVQLRVVVASPVFTLFPLAVTETFHAVPLRGRWRWILSRDQYAYYSTGTGPYAP